jgi:TonB-linked SusC/RagA family outer membrane protein
MTHGRLGVSRQGGRRSCGLRRLNEHRSARAVTLALGIATFALATPLGAQSDTTVVSAPSQTQGEPRGSAQSREREPAKSALDRTVTLDMRDVPLKVVLDEIDRQAHLGLTYTPRLVPVQKKVTIRVKGATVAEALKIVLRGTKVVPVLTSAGMVMLAEPDTSETRTAVDEVGGVVARAMDSVTNQPLAGVVIGVKGTALTGTTNEQGYFLIPKVPVGMRVITARHLGYAAVEREVAVLDSQAVRVEFALRMGMSRLQEVVTTATGRQRRLELGNDITVLDADSIVRTQPITNVTQLLEGRVPGLIVQHTTGAPGDPARLRLRGASSVYRSNDPIVIVDGIRIYADQSESSAANLTSLSDGGVPAPSPLDRLDPNSIETIEVMKGPSAATLYGADAANGVIVITTKRGRPGPPRWGVSAERGLSYMPGRYPTNYFQWGHGLTDNIARYCPITDLSCTADSLVRFQLLNDPALTVLGHGHRTAVTASVSGGTPALLYSLSGSTSEDLGLLVLPDLEVRRFAQSHGSAPPAWMRRPNEFKTFGGSGSITAKVGESVDVSLSTMLSRNQQSRTSLESQLGALAYTYLDAHSGIYYTPAFSSYSPAPGMLRDFYERTTDLGTSFNNGANVTWRPLPWLSGHLDAGLNMISREDESLLPRGYAQTGDSVGTLGLGNGSFLTRTVNASGVVSTAALADLRAQMTVGANYTSSRVATLVVGGRDIPAGVTSIGHAAETTTRNEHSEAATFGTYVEGQLGWRQRLYASTGIRFDGGTTFGSHAKLAGFPKVGLSYLLSSEPFFPFKSVFNTLRLRVAYGHAGVQPGPGDRLRFYAHVPELLDEQPVDVTQIQSLGNTQIRPERSAELEAGFDADLFDDRVSIGLTRYSKTREDALMQVPLPPSVYGGGTILKNVGVIRNTGLEVTFAADLLRSTEVTWHAQLAVSRNRNRVIALGPGVTPFSIGLGRVQAGYPLFGVWARPIVGFADVNENGVIERNEVQVGDSASYMGASEPNYEASLSTGLALFRGAIRIDATVDYQNGLTQVNAAALGHQAAAWAINDPNAPFAEQAAMVASNGSSASTGSLGDDAQHTAYGVIQTVSTLRFNSLSVAFHVPSALAQHFGARNMSIALQGTNLGLHTNYRGKDPNVNANSTGNGILDSGQLPQPRSWQLRVSLGY